MLRRLSVGALVACFLSLPALAQDKAGPAAWSPERMMQLKQIADVQVSPDGKRVVYTVRSAVMEDGVSEYRTHLHLANADGSGAIPLTQGTKSCSQPQWSPDGEWVAFLSNRSGRKALWRIRPGGGEAERVHQTDSDIQTFKWSPDGGAIAFTAVDPPTAAEKQAVKQKTDVMLVDENIKHSRLYVVGTKSGEKREARLLTKGDFSVAPGGSRGRGGYDWAPDGKTIVFTRVRTPRPDDWPSSDLALVDVGSGAVKPLAQSPAAEFSPLYSPDGKSIAFVASDNPPTWAGAGGVQVVPASGGAPRSLADTFDQFGRYSELVGWSADGKRVLYTECRSTRITINSLPLDGKPEAISKAEGTITSAHLNSTRTMLGYSQESLGRASEGFLTAAERFVPVQVSRVNQVLESPLGKTEVIRWKSVDGLEVEGLLTYPAGYAAGKKYPLLLIVHGGPMGVFTETFVGDPGPYPVATFAARGFAVLRPNIRGSSGYGKKFRYANYGDWGGKDYQDLMAGVDHVIGLGVADADRLGVMGWSYGGFMTSWVVTQTRRFKAASVGAGVTNLMSFTGTADIPSFLPDYFGGEFWDKLDAYRNHSAMFQVKGVSTPTLIQHGERDERVPLPQGQEFYNALKRQGCPVAMVIYPRTPHGIEEPKLLLDCMERNLKWFEKLLGGRK